MDMHCKYINLFDFSTWKKLFWKNGYINNLEFPFKNEYLFFYIYIDNNIQLKYIGTKYCKV